MKGLPTSLKSSNCFRNTSDRSILSALCFYCSFSRPRESTEYSKEYEKPYKHVPTHAASSFLRTTTPPTMRGGLEPVLDAIALRDLNPVLAEAVYDEGLAELAVIDGRVTNEISRVGSAEDENTPEVAISNELHPDIKNADEGVRDGYALNETVPEVSGIQEVLVAGETEMISPHAGCSTIGSPQKPPKSNPRDEAFEV